MRDRVRWKATLDDGTTIEPPTSPDEIDRDRCRSFLLFEVDTGRTLAELVIPDPKKQRIVYRCRKDFTIGQGTTQACHMAGVREEEKDTVVWVVDRPGNPLEVYQTKGYDKEHGLFYPPVFRPQEEPWLYGRG